MAAQEIIVWFYAHIAPDNSINEEQLRKQTLKIVASKLRDINNSNGHNIHLSRSQLRQVINYAMKELDIQIKQIKKPNHLNFTVRILASILNFISEIYYSFKRFKAYKKLKEFTQSKNPADKVYIKILNNLSYKAMIPHVGVAREILNWLERSRKSAQYNIEKNLDEYANPQIKEELQSCKKQILSPILSKCVIAAKVQTVNEALDKFTLTPSFCSKNKALIERININFGAEDILSLFQSIPGLEEITQNDVDFSNIALEEQLAMVGQLQALNKSLNKIFIEPFKLLNLLRKQML